MNLNFETFLLILTVGILIYNVWLIKNNIVIKKDIEKPKEKKPKKYLIPGIGAFKIESKKKAIVNDDNKAWLIEKENNYD